MVYSIHTHTHKRTFQFFDVDENEFPYGELILFIKFDRDFGHLVTDIMVGMYIICV